MPLKVKVGAAAEQDVSDWLAGLTEAVAESAVDVIGGAGPVTGVLGAAQDNVYVAGPEAATTGLVTTRTASPEPEVGCGMIVSGFAARVPGPANVRVASGEFLPSD
jgi:hypothetical protein